MKYKKLNDNIIENEEENRFLKVMYGTIVGRVLLKVITKPLISKIIGELLSKKISTFLVKKYIKKYNIDVSKCEKIEFENFNDFFVRKLKNIEKKSKEYEFISTADSKLIYYPIQEDLIIQVKNSRYSINELIKNKEIANEYKDGICLIYRLSPNDYHRYIFVDDGEQEKLNTIKGKLHTVNPISYEKYKVFVENTREVSLLKTKNFNNIIQIEVGALCVGKIRNNNCKQFSRYNEKGFFEFGGSTIIQLIKKDTIVLDSQIIENSEQGIETKIKIGDIIGKARNR